MVYTVVLVSIASPVIIVLIVVLILLISTRSSISGMKDDLKTMKDDLKRMKSHVNINTEAVDLIIPWVSAAQKTFMIPGFGSY